MAKNEAAVANRPDVANVNRTSDVAMADYVFTLVQHAPEALEGVVDDATISQIDSAIAEAGDLFQSSTDKAIQRAIDTKVEAAVRALTNDAELTGYAGRAFDAEKFAAKLAPKKSRRLDPATKAARVVDTATDEQLEALAALLKERGLA